MTDTAPIAIDAILAEHADLERQLSDPELHVDAGRRPQGGPAVRAAGADRRRPTASWRRPAATSRPPANWPPTTTPSRPRSPNSTTTVDELDTQLTDLLAPRDPHDADDIVLEVKSGEGGEESALFAADLARMYIRYAERHGWTVDDARRDDLRSRRLQGRHAVDRAARATPPTACGRG